MLENLTFVVPFAALIIYLFVESRRHERSCGHLVKLCEHSLSASSQTVKAAGETCGEMASLIRELRELNSSERASTTGQMSELLKWGLDRVIANHQMNNLVVEAEQLASKQGVPFDTAYGYLLGRRRPMPQHEQSQE